MPAFPGKALHASSARGGASPEIYFRLFAL